MMLNNDYSDMLRALAAEDVSFLLVGAYAMAAHGYPRATMDIDLWVQPSATNASAVLRALQRFGAPLHGLTAADLQHDDTIFQIGVAPRRIDIITGVSGLDFATAWPQAHDIVLGDLHVRVLSLDDLIVNKLASGRPKDVADVAALKALRAKTTASAKARPTG